MAGFAWRRIPSPALRERWAFRLFPPRDAEVEISVGPGVRLLLDLSDGDQWRAWFAQFRSPALVPLLEVVLRPGDVYIDVGANVGLYSCWAGRLVGPSGRVFAFEPIAYTRSRLLQNALLSETLAWTDISAVAAGDVEDEVIMYRCLSDSGWSSRYPMSGETSAEVCRMARLENEIPAVAPQLVKVDVEGFECQVWDGLGALLDHRPAVVLECTRLLSRCDRSPDDLARRVRAAGYDVWWITPQGLRPVRGPMPQESGNMVALDRHRHARVIPLLESRRFDGAWWS